MKVCPLCAEKIQDAAVKCRFCGSMLSGSSPAPLEATPPPGRVGALPVHVIFDGCPSWKGWFWSYVGAVVLSLVVVGLVWLWLLELKRRSRRVRITDRGIDYEVGIFGRRIETLPLWRVRDIEFRQSALSRILGIATIHVFTSDVTDPSLILQGLPASRDVFDQLRDATEIVRQQRVVGVVE